MKKRISLVLAALILLSTALTSCGASKYSVTDANRTYQIQKKGGKRVVSVLENDRELWKSKVKTNGTLDRGDETLGLTILDLNFAANAILPSFA